MKEILKRGICFVQSFKNLFGLYKKCILYMAIVSDGNSEIGAHVRSNIYFFYARATCSELPSNISTKILCNNDNRNLAHKLVSQQLWRDREERCIIYIYIYV